MNGERNLSKLLCEMTPALAAPVYVYCTFRDDCLPAGLHPVCQFREVEGLTAVVEKSEAEELGAPWHFDCRMITLSIHSDLSAVGFLAAIHATLADAGIPCNSVAAYYHDHLFVPADRADDAMRLLHSMATEMQASRT